MTSGPRKTGPTVFVIEDDGDVRDSLEGLFRSVGLSVALFETVQSFEKFSLEQEADDRSGDIVFTLRKGPEPTPVPTPKHPKDWRR